MARKPPKPKKNDILLDFGSANSKQAQFYTSTKLYTAYGGARGGGKSHAVRVKSVSGALTYPGITILIVRRTYPDLENSIISPLVKMIPPGLGTYNSQMHTVFFANGSIIKFGHYQGTGSASEYQGQEYDWVFIDEATQFTEDEFRTLGGCLRGTNNFPKRMYLTCNPGGVGHQWVKRLFIDRNFRTDSLNPEENENPDDYAFIFATVEDNEALLKGSPAYLQMLSALPENIRRAHRYGDWEALGGAYFPEFKRHTHVYDPQKLLMTVPREWAKYRVFDYGLDMFACLWIAVDFSGRCWVYRQAQQKGLIVSEAAQMMHALTPPEENISYTIAPPDMWSTQKDTGRTMAEIFQQHGIGLVRANNNRVQGWLSLKELLKVGKDGKPMLMVSSECRGLINDLPALQCDDKNPSDCAKQPHEITHGPDALRYFAQSRTMPGFREEVRNDWDEDEEIEDYDSAMTGGEITQSYISY